MIDIVVMLGFIAFLLFGIFVLWSMCKVSGRMNDDEEQIRWLKERKDKDDMSM